MNKCKPKIQICHFESCKICSTLKSTPYLVDYIERFMPIKNHLYRILTFQFNDKKGSKKLEDLSIDH